MKDKQKNKQNPTSIIRENPTHGMLAKSKFFTIQRALIAFPLALILLTAMACNGGGLFGGSGSSEPTQESVSMSPTRTADEANVAVQEASQVLPPAEEQFPSQRLLGALYEQISPSIVDIEVTAVAEGSGGLFGGGSQLVQGEGSGWIYDEQGHVVTNNHVVEGAEEIIVNFTDGSWTRGEIVATDPQADLAVLRIEAPSGITLRPLPLAATETVGVGNWVLAFGTPFGLDGSMTLGIISATGRGFPMASSDGVAYTLPDVLQTDTAINPGNSGGPLLNLAGEVVGVNFAINSPVRASAGVGFAIPVNIVERIVPALIRNGGYAYPYLGISGGEVSPQLAQAENIPDGVFGVWVGSVPSGGPGDEAGLRAGDIITAIDGVTVRSFDDLVSYLLNNTQVGQEVTLTILRNGNGRDLALTLQGRPGSDVPGSDVEVLRDDTNVPVSRDEAIQIASDAVTAANMIERVDDAVPELQSNLGAAVWVVTLEGDGRTATVVVDATTGEVLEVSVL